MRLSARAAGGLGTRATCAQMRANESFDRLFSPLLKSASEADSEGLSDKDDAGGVTDRSDGDPATNIGSVDHESERAAASAATGVADSRQPVVPHRGGKGKATLVSPAEAPAEAAHYTRAVVPSVSAGAGSSNTDGLALHDDSV